MAVSRGASHASYRVYLRASERIVCRHEFAAPDDGTAQRIAEMLAEAAADMAGFFELWQGARLVIPLRPPRQGVDAAGTAEVIAAAEAAEAILQSGWAAARSRQLSSRLEAWRKRPDTSRLERLVREAVQSTGADYGNIQLLDPAGHLRIAAQHGFEREFLDYFAVVADTSTSCGRAFNEGGRIIVASVTESAIFRGTQPGTILLRAGVRSTHSTPIMRDGRVRGVISTHRRIDWTPDGEELRRIDGFAADAASVIG